MTWINLITVAVVALTLLALPGLSRCTVPLGVSVPSTHTGDPAVLRAQRRYRIGVSAGFVLIAVLVGVFSSHAPGAAGSVGVLAMVLLGAASLLISRRQIIAAKRAGGWYDGVAVGIGAQVTAAPQTRIHQPWPWHAGSVAVLVATALFGVGLYGRQPDPYPTHWTGSGQPDSFTAKSVFAVFAVLLVMAGVLVVIAGLGWLCARIPQRQYPDGDPDRARATQTARLQATCTGVGVLTFLVLLGIAALQLGTWYGVRGSGLAALLGIFLALTGIGVLALIWLLVRAGRVMSPAGADGRTGVESPDDDRFWKGGIVYVNRNDPSFLVPKRLGVGWTINLGHPAGIASGVLILLVIVAGIVVPQLH